MLELIELRKSLGHTQKSLSDFLKVSLRTVSSWEQGVNPVPWVVILLLRLLNEKKCSF